MILHGCSVPVVLELVNKELDQYKMVGDCYVEGIMHGQIVEWDGKDVHRFILV